MSGALRDDDAAPTRLPMTSRLTVGLPDQLSRSIRCPPPPPPPKNSPPPAFAKDQLKAFIERIERLEEEKKAISDDIRDVYAEAKGNGFDVKALRTIVRLRKQDVDERKEQEAMLETYMHALGMLNVDARSAAAAPARPRCRTARCRQEHHAARR